MTQEDKKIITNEINRRLKQLWLSSSAQADNDDYYRNPLVKQLKELAVFVSNIEESEKPVPADIEKDEKDNTVVSKEKLTKSIEEQHEQLRWLLEPDADDDYYENNW